MNINTVHQTTIVGKCPHGCHDLYEAEFHVGDRLITVESIQEAIDKLTADPIYQEHLTERLAEAVGCRVVTHGRHGSFETTTEADPT